MPGDAAVAAVFEPVQPPTTFEETVERLGTAIRLGILGPGIRLPSERELADQLGISRSTLRQAITTLVQSGHLMSVRGRGGGTFVVQEPPLAEGSPTGPGPRGLARGARPARRHRGRHGHAGRRSRQRGRPRAHARCVDRMAAAAEFDDYRRADIRFHMAIAEATGVPRLVGLVGEVEAEVSELIAHIAHPPEVLDHSNAEHARMIDALARHDATARRAPAAPSSGRHACTSSAASSCRATPRTAHQFVIEALRMWPRSSPLTSRGLTTSRRCCLSAPSTRAGTSRSS